MWLFWLWLRIVDVAVQGSMPFMGADGRMFDDDDMTYEVRCRYASLWCWYLL
jgi:hypothetical protein